MIDSPPVELFRFISCQKEIGFQPIDQSSSLLGSLLPSSQGDFQCQQNLSGYSPRAEFTASSSLGGSGAMFESTQDISLLQQHTAQQKNATGLTISVQMTPSLTNSSDPFPILTIGKEKTDTLQSPSPTDFLCDNYELLLAQFQTFLFFSYRANDVARSCRTRVYTEAPLLMNHLNTITVTTDENATSVYLQGALLSRSAQNPFDIISWDPLSRVQLFSHPFTRSTFPGIIHSVAVYDTALTVQDVDELYHQMARDVNPTLPPTLAPSSSLSPTLPLAIEAAPPTCSLTLQQGQVHPVTFAVGSLNYSTQELALAVDILAWPRYGRLGYLDGTPALSRIDIPRNHSSILLQYKLMNTTYFNAPKIDARGETLPFEPEMFQYRIVTDDGAAASEIMTQIIHVLHENHPPTLTAPTVLYASNLDDQVLQFDGVVLDDGGDWSMDMVRVDVSTQHGTLSWSSAFAPSSDFVSCTQRAGSWCCRSDPHSVTFVAVPDEVSLILQELEYRPEDFEISDSIVIGVFDGQGGECLDETEHTSTFDEFGMPLRTIYSECFAVESIIQYVAPTLAPTAIHGAIAPTVPLPSTHFRAAPLLFWVVMTVATILFLLGLKLILNWFVRGTAIEPESQEGSNQNSVYCL